MTREEAIADIRDNIKPVVGGISLDMAIEALEQQPCEDCISRQAVLALPTSKTRTLRGEIVEEEVNIELIKALPPVTPKEKTAAWVPVDAEPHDIYECNACGWLLYYEDRTDFKYCPNCGAKMI